MNRIEAFSIKEVKNEDSYCINALAKETEYLVSFDVGRLLAGFRETAGLDMKGKKRYDGWENTLIGGHTMGHYLTALAQAYANPGVKDADKVKIDAMLDELLSGLAECQANSKGRPGFLFGATLTDKGNVESQFDNVEKLRIDIKNEAWVPWYTMHKIIAGTVEVYKLTGKKEALTIAEGLGNWTYERTSKWDKATNEQVLKTEYGGMNDCLYELFSITKDEKYAVAAHRFDEVDLFEKIAAGEKDNLLNIHANTTIPKFMGALNRYITCDGKTIDGSKIEASRYLLYAKKFWQTVLERHTYITGGNSEWEHFREDFSLNAKRTNCNCETCNVHNMLKFSKKLFEITGDKKYADYYERAYLNAILPSQNPETGMSMYFQPMATGYFKVFSTPWTKFWCCTGTGMENFTKLNDGIFCRDVATIYVNIYENATLDWGEANLKLMMKADLQKSDTAVFKLQKIDEQADCKKVGLKLRIPDWAAGEPTVFVDGKKVDRAADASNVGCGFAIENGYIKIDYETAKDKEIKVTLPMEVRAHTLPDSPHTFAFKYGPFVLSANLGTKDMTEDETGVIVTIPKERVTEYDNIVLPDGVTLEEFLSNPDPFFEKEYDANGLTLTLSTNGMKFNPHFMRYKERYGIYFGDGSNDTRSVPLA